MRKILLIVLIIWISYTSKSQCNWKNKTFSIGEKLTYNVYYHWGFIWVEAGYAVFSVNHKTYENKPVYYLNSFGSSYSSYDWMFKVRDNYQTYLDIETLQPLWHLRKNYEGGYEVNNEYSFNWNSKTVNCSLENSDKALTKKTIPVEECTFDLLSLIYYARNLDFSNLKIKDTIPVKAIIDGEIYNLYLRYLGKETIKDRDDKSYNCIKFTALLVEGTIFKGGEDMTIWITDDNNKIPVLVKAKILIGSVEAFLLTSEGLRY